MKRNQVRYTSEDQLISEIDKAKMDARNALERAIYCDNAAKEALRHAGVLDESLERETRKQKRDEIASEIHRLKFNAEALRKEASRLSQKRNRIETATLPRLSTALAEFRTMLLPITDDPAVVLR